MVSFIVQKKLETLESMISKEEQEVLKSGLMEQKGGDGLLGHPFYEDFG